MTNGTQCALICRKEATESLVTPHSTVQKLFLLSVITFRTFLVKRGIAVCESVIPVKYTFGILFVFHMAAQNIVFRMAAQNDVIKVSVRQIRIAQYRRYLMLAGKS